MRHGAAEGKVVADILLTDFIELLEEYAMRGYSIGGCLVERTQNVYWICAADYITLAERELAPASVLRQNRTWS